MNRKQKAEYRNSTEMLVWEIGLHIKALKKDSEYMAEMQDWADKWTWESAYKVESEDGWKGARKALECATDVGIKVYSSEQDRPDSMEDYEEEQEWGTALEYDADTLAGAGWGTDEDYGGW